MTVTAKRNGISSKGKENALKLDLSDGCTSPGVHGKTLNYKLILVNFVLYDFCLD